MNEKRFKSFYGYAVEDMETGKKYSDNNTEELVELLNSQNREIMILQQRIKILREEIQSTVYILKMQTRKLEGY